MKTREPDWNSVRGLDNIIRDLKLVVRILLIAQWALGIFIIVGVVVGIMAIFRAEGAS